MKMNKDILIDYFERYANTHDPSFKNDLINELWRELNKWKRSK